MKSKQKRKKERKQKKHVEILLWQKCDRKISFAMLKFLITDTSRTLF